MKELSRIVNATTGKPEAYIMVSVQGGVPMCFAKSEEPCAFCELFSIGAIGGEKNVTIAREVMALVTSRLQVPANRTYMNFVDAGRADFGWNGTTFASM
jgi:phenylpyruvate tautomerase